MLNSIRAWLAREPAVTAWMANGGLALLAAYVFHWGPTWQAAAATTVTALAALYSAWRARPAHIQVAVGAVTSLLAAAATFGLHVSPHTKAMVLAGASVVLALLWRQHVTPVVTLREQAAKAAAAARKLRAPA